jgi:pimeloyl-ACP methyl ester carboxylesterase
VQVPTACAVFPKEINIPPRRWVEAQYNLTRWTEMPRGGHFAALEEPELLVEDIRAFFRTLR